MSSYGFSERGLDLDATKLWTPVRVETAHRKLYFIFNVVTHKARETAHRKFYFIFNVVTHKARDALLFGLDNCMVKMVGGSVPALKEKDSATVSL